MRNEIWTAAVSLAAMSGILLVGGVTWAQAEETPIEVQFYGCRIQGSPEREWVDDEGIRHIRDQMFRCRRTRDMVGRDVGWASGDQDLAGGYTFERGYYAFTGTVLGGELTGGVGRYTEECNKIEGVWNCTSHDVMHLNGGSLVKLSATYDGDDPVLIYSGTLLDPPGGESRNGPRSK